MKKIKFIDIQIPQIILTLDDFKEYIENLKSEFSSIVDEMQQKESQWIFIKIIFIEYIPL